MRRWWHVLAMMALVACDGTMPSIPTTAPPPRPERSAVPSAPATAPAGGELSAQAAAYYAHVQASFLSQGLMRTDGGASVPFTSSQLVDAFLNIAFYEEYADQGGRLVSRATPSLMQRWEVPVRIHVISGPSVDPRKAARDRAIIAAYAARLARLTGHSVGMSAGTGNFTVLILTEDERRAYDGALAQLMPGLGASTRDAIIDMDPSTYCLVVARDGPGSSAYSQAVAVIRAEHPDLLRLSCIHEELAQGLGLANDDPDARPSIFNDDEEYALLTRMDELMLRMLYDPRLRPGMTEAEARPIVEKIAEELMGGPV